MLEKNNLFQQTTLKLNSVNKINDRLFVFLRFISDEYYCIKNKICAYLTYNIIIYGYGI